MNEQWPTVRLGHHIEASLGKMLDAQKNKGQLHPYLGNSNVRWGRFDLADLAQMRFESHEEERYGIRHGDLIVCEGGEPGRCAIWKEEIPSMKIQKALHRIRPKESLNNYYLLYWFMLAASTGRLEPYFTGTTIKHLTGKAVDALELKLPPIAVQEAIASALKSLDDKIELNRRMNDTLEAMARAIFQSWFVDFDPVRAKASGEDSDAICTRLGLTPELQALFPDGFVDSALGEIPSGWKVCALDEVASYLNGLALQKYPAEEGADWLPVIKIAQLRAGHTLAADRANTQVPAGYVIEDGDVLFSWSGSLEVDTWCGGKGALNQHLFKVTSEEYPKWFYLLWTKHHLNSFRDIAANKATTMGHIQRKHLSEAKVLCPSLETLSEMTKVMAPLIEKTISNRLEAACLAKARDTLLPELLSGKVRANSGEDQS